MVAGSRITPDWHIRTTGNATSSACGLKSARSVTEKGPGYPDYGRSGKRTADPGYSILAISASANPLVETSRAPSISRAKS